MSLQDADTSTASFTAPTDEADLSFELRVTAGTDWAAGLTTVRVRNQAPVVTGLHFMPESPRVTDGISVISTVSDPDQDRVTVSHAWKQNGELIAGATTAALPALSVRGGDTLTAIVTASDGLLISSAEASIAIGDIPFNLTATPPDRAAYGSLVQFSVAATAPDGTPRSEFVLNYGPAGMTMSPDGQVSWTAVLPMFETTLDVHWEVALGTFPTNRLGGTIRVEDPLRQQLFYRYGAEIPRSHSTLHVADLDGDGSAEVLVGSSWGMLRSTGTSGLAELALGGGSLAQRWANPFSLGLTSPVSAISARDIDGDGKNEIFIAGGDVLVKIDGATRREVARFESGGAFTCTDLAVADLKLDGLLEVVCLGVPPSQYLADRIAVLDAATLAVKWQIVNPALGAGMAVANVDVGTGAAKWTSGTIGRAISIAHGDMTGDGVPDFLALFDGDDTSLLYAYDVKDQVFLGAIPDLPAGGIVTTADLDGDGLSEAIVLVVDQLHVFRWSGSPPGLASVASVAVPFGYGLAVADCDGDGVPEIYVLRYLAPTTSVARYDTALQLTGSFNLDASALSLYVEQLGSGRKNLLIGSGGVPWAHDPAMLLAVDPISGAEIWRSPTLEGSPLAESLSYLNVGGGPRITFGTTSGMYLTR